MSEGTEKEWREQWCLNRVRFFKLASQLSGNALPQPESSQPPDFRIQSERGTLGVEVTQARCEKEAAALRDFSRAAKAVHEGEKIKLPQGAYKQKIGDHTALVAQGASFRTDNIGRKIHKLGFCRSHTDYILPILIKAINRKCASTYEHRWGNDFIEKHLIVYCNYSSITYAGTFEGIFSELEIGLSFYRSIYFLSPSGQKLIQASKDGIFIENLDLK